MVRDGYKFAAPPLVCGAFALSVQWYATALVLLLLGAFVVYFFRDPHRTPPAEPDAIVSPADGRIMETVREAFGETPGHRISIFLSIFDVHVNRAPFEGRISKLEYRRGKFLAAMRQRASIENEQNVIYLATERGDLVFKQIAGWIARRILFWKPIGATVGRGERVGMIRFGSRVDLWLPESVEIVVRPGQHVSAGSSVLARWR